MRCSVMIPVFLLFCDITAAAAHLYHGRRTRFMAAAIRSFHDRRKVGCRM